MHVLGKNMWLPAIRTDACQYATLLCLQLGPTCARQLAAVQAQDRRTLAGEADARM